MLKKKSTSILEEKKYIYNNEAKKKIIKNEKQRESKSQHESTNRHTSLYFHSFNTSIHPPAVYIGGDGGAEARAVRQTRAGASGFHGTGGLRTPVPGPADPGPPTPRTGDTAAQPTHPDTSEGRRDEVIGRVKEIDGRSWYCEAWIGGKR